MFETNKTELPKLTDRLKLGEEGLLVSPICLGYVKDPATISAAFDAGINFFFISTDMHWPYYEGTRRGLEDLLRRGGGIRDQIVIAATCYPTQPEFCRFPFYELIDAVTGLSSIDVGVAGGAYSDELHNRLPIYSSHRASNFLGMRGIGVSFHDRSAALDLISSHRIDIGFVRYNPIHVGAAIDLFPFLNAREPSLVYNFKSTSGFRPAEAYSQLGVSDDYWFPKITDYYRFALSRPQIDGVLCSLNTSVQVVNFVEALSLGPLHSSEQEHLVALASLMQNVPSADGMPGSETGSPTHSHGGR